MKKYLLLLTVTLSLYGQTPKSFAALGDVLYNDVEKFQALKQMASMQEFSPAIDAYIEAAAKTKEMGFTVDAKNASTDPKEYLKALRLLSTEHDAIIVHSRARFKEAIADEDGETINKMVLYGVIDPENYQDELIHYYEEFYEDQNLSTLEPMYTHYAASLKKEDDNTTKLTEAELQAKKNAERIERMRAKEKAKTEALESSVKEEKEREKKKVLSEQKKELGIE